MGSALKVASIKSSDIGIKVMITPTTVSKLTFINNRENLAKPKKMVNFKISYQLSALINLMADDFLHVLFPTS